MESKLPHTISPCKDCPFRKDSLKSWLGKDRMSEIVHSPSFVCHKRVDLQCSGHMLVNGERNSFVKLAQQLGITLRLNNRHLVFDSIEECIRHHT